MPIINQVVKGCGGGNVPNNYVELYIENGQLKKGNVKSVDFSGVTTATETFYMLFKGDTTVSGSVILKDLTNSGALCLRDTFYRTNVTYADLSGMTRVYGNGLYNTFQNTKLTGFDMSNLTQIDSNYAMYYTFAGIQTLVGVFSFPKLEVCLGGMNVFSGDRNITFFGLPKLKTIGSNNVSSAFQGFFGGCSGLTGVNINAVEEILGNYQQMDDAFTGTAIQVFRFPMLTTVTNGIGTRAFSTTVTEFHFRIDAQATIEATAGYSTKWGATNATVYFDLVGTLTGADGNTYTRDEYNSVYSDQHGQFQTAVAWKYNDTTYYTPFSANEPAVGDTIYSDSACTTAVTTVSAIA